MNGKQVYLRAFTPEDAEALLSFQRENQSFFERFSMERGEDFYTIEAQRHTIKQYEENITKDQEYQFGIFKKESHHLVGTINLFQVLRGSLQCAFIGYFMDENHNGKGYMTEAVQLIVNYAFEHLQLHRIEAGVMPRNGGSIRVLEKAGFHKEGLAKKNVKINGKWEDHQVLAILNPAD